MTATLHSLQSPDAEQAASGAPARPLPALGRSGRGPLGALPGLSPSARRALAGCAVLACLGAAALAVQAWMLASVLADTVTGAVAHDDNFAPRLAVLAGAVVARALLGWATQVVAARAAAGAKEELRGTLLDSALARGPEWIAARGPAELTVLATKGLDALDAYFTVYLPALVTAAVVPLGIGGVVLLADWPSALVIALTVPLIPLFAVLIGRHTQDRVAAAADATTRLSAHLLEMIRALPVLTAFRRADAQAEAVRRVSDRHRRTSLATLRTVFSSALVLELVGTLSVALVAVVIGVRLVAGDMALGIGLFVLILAPECYFPLRAAGAAHHASEDGLEAVRRVADLVAGQVPGRTGDRPGGRLSGPVTVSVRGLRVQRRHGHAPDGISFTLRPGTITRLDWPSGAGKSTAISVLLGFVPPASGTVSVDGHDLSTMDMEEWRRSVAWVPQRPAFGGGTVRQELELALADRAAPPDEAELAAAAGEALAAHLLDRPVRELSTGERQRVAVARALLRVRRGARVLLLDEPTAHLDPATAGRVMAAVHAVAESGVAVLLATHRLTEPGESAAPASSSVTPSAEHRSQPVARLRELLSRRTVGGAALGALALVSGVALTATSAWLIAKASLQPPILTLSVAVVGVRTFGLARAVLRYLERLVSHDAAFRRAGELRVRLWQRMVALGPARTIGLRRTEGLQRIVDDVDTVRDLTPRVLTPPITAALVCVAAVVVQTAILPAAGAVLAATALVAGPAAPLLTRWLDRRATAALAEGRRQVAAGVLGLLDAAPDLIATGAHRKQRAALAATDADLVVRARHQAFGEGAGAGLITLLTGLAALAGTAFGAVAAAAGTLHPTLVPVLALVPLTLAEPLALLPTAIRHHAVLRAAYARVHTLLAPSPAPAVVGYMCAESSSDGYFRRTCSKTSSRGGDIRLEGVDVRWPGAGEPSLRDVTLHIPAGSHVAVVGPSGAGKSTLLALFLGFLAPERGVAHVPGRVAWCPQEPQLVSTTIRENLKLGNPEATTQQYRDALTAAGLGRLAETDHDTDALDTRIGAGGGALSGGEAQRLALARALLAAPDADVVLLDEPTAQLDVPTAHRLLAGLREALAGRTVVHVTHRPEEIADADLVIEVTDGGLRVRELAA